MLGRTNRFGVMAARPPRQFMSQKATTQTISLTEVLCWGVAAYGAYKGLQALFDEDFGDGEFPRSVRHELIDEHVAQHGAVCPECGAGTDRDEFTVDHIVAMVNGGLTSRNNAQVMCGSCNSRKGAKNSVMDYIRGRSR